VEGQFSVEANRMGTALVLAVGGELDLSSSAALEQNLERALASDAPCVIVDLRAVEFIDSTGLGVLVKANQQARDAGRQFGLVQGGSQVQRLLSLTGLSERMTVADTPEEIVGGA
jgi:anti-sigma B factor antagonist